MALENGAIKIVRATTRELNDDQEGIGSDHRYPTVVW